jgi:SAM-dependent methyltransferase
MIDAVLCLDLIEHIDADGELVKEISRVLKKEGKLILTTPMQDGVNFPGLPKKYAQTINRQWGHVRAGYSMETLKELCERNNIKIEKRNRYFNFFSRSIYWLRFLAGVFSKIGDRIFHIVIKLEPYIKFKAEEHIIIAKKI